ncbi:MAG: RidA family protein [Gammaproteobacteria bacterium]|nr:RidA family protein [Gammaproteobacteria bacterium]
MTNIKIKSGGRFEDIGSYSRVRRIGPFVFIAGTTAIEESGKLHQPNDTYAQTRFILEQMERYLNEVGAELQHVVRTRGFLTSMADAGQFVKAHGEIFEGIDPVTAAVEAGLTQQGMMVEIEVDAIIHDENGAIDFR